MARFGSLGTQYFDDAGDPLVDGYIRFTESGTNNTDKNTYSDPNLSAPSVNENPVPLTAAGRQPNIFFNGVARATLYTSAGVQVDQRDPVGGAFESGDFSEWNALTVYNQGSIVEGSDGNFYVSITNNNTNNDPTSDAVNWTRIKFVRVWNSNETYTTDDIVQGSDGLIYRSKTSSNLNNDPVSDSTNWGPATSADIPNVIEAASASYAYNTF